jgi:hypothetical protein
MTEPILRGGRDAATSAILVLHGGREHGLDRTHPLQHAYLRMIDLYVGLRLRSRRCAVYLLQHRVRGWNAGLAEEPSPVSDARWALKRIASTHPGLPIALLGHSMGGRTAFAVTDSPGVVGVCALAPWLPEGEPLPAQNDRQRFVIAHGDADHTTSPAESLAFAGRLREQGGRVAYLSQAGGRHALLDEPWLWHRFAVRTSLGLVGERPFPEAVRRGLDGNAALEPGELGRFDV